MTILKCGIILILFLLEYSNQVSIASENSEIGIDKTGYLQEIGHCLNKQSNALPRCIFKHALHRLEQIIENNDTWQLTDYVALKKNSDWKPVELEARDSKNLLSAIMGKLSDLLTSRSLQFSIPNEQQMEGRSKHSYMSGIGSISSTGGGTQTGRKKNKNKHGMMFSGFALVAMLAQLFLGKIAFLAGASLLLSKIALLFSVVNGLKKQTGGSSGGEHVVYSDQGHGNSWQRSIPESPDWNKDLLK